MFVLLGARGLAFAGAVRASGLSKPASRGGAIACDRDESLSRQSPLPVGADSVRSRFMPLEFTHVLFTQLPSIVEVQRWPVYDFFGIATGSSFLMVLIPVPVRVNHFLLMRRNLGHFRHPPDLHQVSST